MITQKGQGTIEYLVIIAIVVVIALVVVGLLLQVMGQGGGIPETTAKSAWKSGEPLAIVDWGKSTTGVLTIILRNNSYEAIGFNSIDLNGGTDENTTSKIISAGDTYTLTMAGHGTCTSGEKFSYSKENIVIDYNTPNIPNKTQAGLADIIGSC